MSRHTVEAFYDKDKHHTFTALIERARVGDLDGIIALLQRSIFVKTNENLDVDCGMTALNMAIREKQHHVVKYFLSLENTNLGLADGQRDAPLSMAVMSQNDDVIKWLLEDPRVDVYCTEGPRFHTTAIHFAVALGDIDVVKLLLRHMPDRTSDAAIENFYEASYFVCTRGDVRIAELLVDEGCFKPRKGQSMGRLIREASQYNQANVLRYLLKRFDRLNSEFSLMSFAGQRYLIDEHLSACCVLGSIHAALVVLEFVTTTEPHLLLALFQRFLLALSNGHYKIASLILDKCQDLDANILDKVALVDVQIALRTRCSSVIGRLYRCMERS